MYLVCFMRTTWLTSDANDFVNAKSHAEDRNSARTVPHPFLSDIIDPRFGFFMFWKGSLSKIRWHLPRRVPPMVDYKGYLFFPPCKGIQDSLGFWIPRHGLRIPGTRFIPCQWDLVFEFQSIIGFRITWAVFRIPEPRIPDSTSKFSRIQDSRNKNLSDSGIRIPWRVDVRRFFTVFILLVNERVEIALDLLTSRAFERVARSYECRAWSASERAKARSCRALPHQPRKPCERLWESLGLRQFKRIWKFRKIFHFGLKQA